MSQNTLTKNLQLILFNIFAFIIKVFLFICLNLLFVNINIVFKLNFDVWFDIFNTNFVKNL